MSAGSPKASPRANRTGAMIGLAFALLLCEVPAYPAAPTQVQVLPSTCFTSGGSVSMNCSFTSNVTAGNMLVVCLGADAGNSFNTPTMTGETFTAITNMTNVSNTTNEFKCWTTHSAAGGQKQVSFSTSGSTGVHLHGHGIEVNGQSATPEDCSNNVAPQTTINVACTATNANDLGYVFVIDEPNNDSFTATSGWAQAQQTNDSAGGDSAFSERQTFSATGSHAASASGNGTDAVAQGILMIAGSGGGATCTPTLTLLGVGRC